MLPKNRLAVATQAKPLVRGRSALRRHRPNCTLPGGAILKLFQVEDIQRLRRLAVDPLECVVDDSFRSTRAETLYSPETLPHHDLAAPTGNGARPHNRRTLTLAEERELFLRFNYARFRMMRILKAFKGRRLTVTALRELLAWEKARHQVCDEVVRANLGLVPTMVERSRIVGVDFGELISEGHMALLRAIDKFDCNRGFKFSTYACRAILTALTRAVALMARHRGRFPAEYDPDLQPSDFVQSRRSSDEDDYLGALKSALKGNRAELTRNEKRILNERFGNFGRPGSVDGSEQKTLREVARIFGVTKERVRQIQNRALDKLRNVIDAAVTPE